MALWRWFDITRRISCYSMQNTDFKYAHTYPIFAQRYFSILINYDKLFWLHFIKTHWMQLFCLVVYETDLTGSKKKNICHHNLPFRWLYVAASIYFNMSTIFCNNNKIIAQSEWYLLILSRILIQEICYFIVNWFFSTSWLCFVNDLHYEFN